MSYRSQAGVGPVLLRYRSRYEFELPYRLAGDLPPFFSVITDIYRPRVNCVMVIAPKHAVIVRFFLVMAYILRHPTTISMKPS